MFIEWMDTSTERNGHKEPCIEGMLLSGKAADAIPILEERYKGNLSTRAQEHSAARMRAPDGATMPRESRRFNGAR